MIPPSASLLSLPPELRRRVYKMVSGGYLPRYIQTGLRVYHASIFETRSLPDRTLSRDIVAILCTCSLMHEETKATVLAEAEAVLAIGRRGALSMSIGRSKKAEPTRFWPFIRSLELRATFNYAKGGEKRFLEHLRAAVVAIEEGHCLRELTSITYLDRGVGLPKGFREALRILKGLRVGEDVTVKMLRFDLVEQGKALETVVKGEQDG